MAYEYLNLLDVAKLNSDSKVVEMIEENVTYAPEARIIPMREPIAGTEFTTLIRKTVPKPAFRAANEGVEPKKSTYDLKLVECFYIDGHLEMDVMVARKHIDGEQAALALEEGGMMQGTLQLLGSQLWYGTGNDAKGFPGAAQMVDSSLVVDAGGTTADTGSSVYALMVGPQYVQFVPGRGNVFTFNEWLRTYTIRSSKELEVWKNNLSGYIGVQWVNKFAVGRIRDLTADSAKGLTDTLIQDLLDKFPVGYRPHVFFMSRRSCTQLQKSRTVVINASAGSKPANIENVAPRPTEAFGIPIVETDSIVNTEALS